MSEYGTPNYVNHLNTNIFTVHYQMVKLDHSVNGPFCSIQIWMSGLVFGHSLELR
jgi:hypothetical protein